MKPSGTPLSVVVASRTDASGGGAGRVADELGLGLRRDGCRVVRLVRESDHVAPGTLHLPKVPLEGVARIVTGSDLGGAFLRAVAHASVDVVHLHDSVIAYGTAAVAAIAGRRPVVLTHHDFSAFTGGCLYPGPCQRWLESCGRCPQHGEGPLWFPVDRTAATLRRNRALARSGRVTTVAPSRYMAALAERSTWPPGSVHVIPNSVDIETHHPNRRDGARAALGLEPTTRVVLFVAVKVDDPRKGFADLLEALLVLDERVTVFVVGRRPEAAVDGDVGRASVRYLGPRSGAGLADLYAAADLVVVPSYQDNLPCVIAESFASGTPVVAYPTGGIPEMVVAGAGTGVLTTERAPGALSAALSHGLASLSNPEARVRARRFAEDQYAPRVFVQRHVALYRSLLERSRAAG